MAHRRSARRRAQLVALVALVLASPVACAADETAAPPVDRATMTATSGGFAPVTLDNCGVEAKVEAAPQRVVTIKSTPTETMLALGLGDRIVGVAYQDGPVPDEWAADAAALPVISDKVPGQEAVLALDPDFVYAGWESNVTADGAGDRAALAGRGIGTYVSPSACQEDGYRPEPLTFDEVFREITEVGALFGVPDEAATLVAEQRAALEAIEPVGGVTAFWWSSGTDTPYAGGGIGAPQMILDAAGVTNTLADVDAAWAPAGWENVVAADPDVLVLVDATWNTFEHKVEWLESSPALSQLTAVREHRYVRLPFASTEAGVRNVEAAQSLAAQVRELGLGG